MESPFRERRLTPEEVRAVLRRLGDAPPTGEAATVGRDELQASLASIGLRGEVVTRAIEGQEAWADDEEPSSLLGGPRRLLFEGELAVELPDDAREDLVEIIREELHDTGRVESLGRSLAWTPTMTMQNPPRKLSVKVRVRDGRTRIRVEEDLAPLRLGAWLGFGVGGGFGLGVFGVVIAAAGRAPWLGAAFSLTLVALSLFLAHTVTAFVSSRRRRELSRLFRKLSAEVERASHTTRPRVAVDAAGDAEQAEAQAQAEAEASAAEGEEPRALAPR